MNMLLINIFFVGFMVSEIPRVSVFGHCKTLRKNEIPQLESWLHILKLKKYVLVYSNTKEETIANMLTD